MNYEHLIVCGGGQVLFSYLGLFKVLLEKEILDIKKIKTIYSVSSGSIMSLLLMLNIEIEIIKNFFINCPWEKMIPFNSNNLFNLINKKGAYDGEDVILKMFKSLFDSIDLSIDTTLKEMYEITNIEFHCFTVNIKDFSFVDMNYKNYPDLKILTAIHMSIAIPFLFSPCIYKNNCYIDGAMIKNYPIDCLIKEQNCDTKTILGVRVFNSKKEELNKKDYDYESNNFTIYEYVKCFFNYFKKISNTDIKKNLIEDEIHIHSDGVSMENIQNMIINKSYREKLFEDGIISAKTFIKYKNL